MNEYESDQLVQVSPGLGPAFGAWWVVKETTAAAPLEFGVIEWITRWLRTEVLSPEANTAGLTIFACMVGLRAAYAEFHCLA